MRKTSIVTIRLSEIELVQLDRLAMATGRNRSDTIRESLNFCAELVADPKAINAEPKARNAEGTKTP